MGFLKNLFSSKVEPTEKEVDVLIIRDDGNQVGYIKHIENNSKEVISLIGGDGCAIFPNEFPKDIMFIVNEQKQTEKEKNPDVLLGNIIVSSWEKQNGKYTIRSITPEQCKEVFKVLNENFDEKQFDEDLEKARQQDMEMSM